MQRAVSRFRQGNTNFLNECFSTVFHE